MSISPARLPPTWRWIVTAVMTKSKFFEPTRSAISCERLLHRAAEARLGEHALELLARRRPALVGDVCRPCRKLWPALSDAASVISRSGSCFSNACVRRLRLEAHEGERDAAADGRTPSRITSAGVADDRGEQPEQERGAAERRRRTRPSAAGGRPARAAARAVCQQLQVRRRPPRSRGAARRTPAAAPRPSAAAPRAPGADVRREPRAQPAASRPRRTADRPASRTSAPTSEREHRQRRPTAGTASPAAAMPPPAGASRVPGMDERRRPRIPGPPSRRSSSRSPGRAAVTYSSRQVRASSCAIAA